MEKGLWGGNMDGAGSREESMRDNNQNALYACNIRKNSIRGFGVFVLFFFSIMMMVKMYKV